MSDGIRQIVRDRYARSANSQQSCCGGGESSDSACCGGKQGSTDWGYTADELSQLPEGADLALGCGNPTALASLEPGETVLDLGSGGGIDCFLAAKRVGPEGRVIGVDMTPEMIDRARANAKKAQASNIEFRLGEIEHLPIADSSVDVVISNCVINLSPEKPAVFADAFRVLKPGGRLMVSDLVLTEELTADLAANSALLTGCIAGAALEEQYLGAIRDAGFTDVQIASRSEYLKSEHLSLLAREAGVSEKDATFIAERLRSISVRAQKRA